jgi:hypothetical protein
VAFVDYSTAYPYVHRDGLSSTLLKNDIRGNMWYHLRARFDKIKLQVLNPGISADHTVDILRGLPEGSHLSPTLFRMFVADLVHEFRAKFPLLQLFTLGRHPPNPHTLGSTMHIWIGGLLYVDDLVLMSTCPRELQAMLHVSQQWSTQSRMRINTEKTKIMASSETLALLPPGVDNIGPAQSCIPFTCTHSSQLPTLARTLFTKSSSSNLSALARGGYGSHFQGIVGEDTRSNIVRHTGYRCECY